MTDINTYLVFNGNCAEAMRFYESTLGGKLDMMTHGQSPIADKLPPGSADRILHARLVLDGGGALMACDDQPAASSKGMHGFSVTLTYPTARDAKRVFDVLATGGKVHMPFEKTFWAEGFGMLVDRFGTPWIINGAMTMS